MFTHLLVPLDGSKVAEGVLPFSASLAERLGAAVTLLHVMEQNAPSAVHGERHLTDTAEARRYLEALTDRYFAGGSVRVDQHVHTNEERNVARSIVAHAVELGADLIVLCTHGRGGLRHRVFGSNAQHVVRAGTIPVLLLPPTAGAPRAFTCEHMLAPLDGRPGHEDALAVAASLARACHAVLHVLAVVPTLGTLSGEQARTGQLLPGTTAAMLELEEREAVAYVARQSDHLRDAGLEVVTQVGRGDPGTVILRTAERVTADVIVMGTHGRTGLDAFWSGSVAPRVSGRAPIPLLLVSVRAE
jgi:nucleotide-binding universal stress UspA family protein